MNKIIYGVVALVVVLALGYYFVNSDGITTDVNSGSSEVVGTTTPNTSGSTPNTDAGNDEEEPLPTRGDVALKLNQPVAMYGITATATQVAEDSRCPQGVQCFQAGTVKVRVDFVTSLGNGSHIFELNKPVVLAGYTILMNRVTPEPQVGKQISDADYVFYFTAGR